MYGVAATLMLVTMALALTRAVKGPTVFDRILAVNVFGTATVVMISVVGFLIGRTDLVDIALLYALVSFTGTIAVLRYVEYERVTRTSPTERAAKRASERTVPPAVRTAVERALESPRDGHGTGDVRP